METSIHIDTYRPAVIAKGDILTITGDGRVFATFRIYENAGLHDNWFTVFVDRPETLEAIAAEATKTAADLRNAINPPAKPDPNTVIGQGGEIVPDEPEPDSCAECSEQAVGYDEGTPLCATHYRSKPAFFDPKPAPDAVNAQEGPIAALDAYLPLLPIAERDGVKLVDWPDTSADM